MIIDANTTASDFAAVEQYVSKEERERLTQAAAEHYCGEGGFWDITLEQLIAMQAGDMPFEVDEGKAFGVYFLQGLSAFVDDFVKKLNDLTIEPSEKEKRAMANCKKMEFGESALIFARSYFGLHNFTDAGKITLGDYYIAKRDSYNKQVYEKASAAIARAERNKR